MGNVGEDLGRAVVLSKQGVDFLLKLFARSPQSPDNGAIFRILCHDSGIRSILLAVAIAVAATCGCAVDNDGQAF